MHNVDWVPAKSMSLSSENATPGFAMQHTMHEFIAGIIKSFAQTTSDHMLIIHMIGKRI